MVLTGYFRFCVHNNHTLNKQHSWVVFPLPWVGKIPTHSSITLQMTLAACFEMEYSAADLENDSPISRAEGIRAVMQAMTMRLRHGLEALTRL